MGWVRKTAERCAGGAGAFEQVSDSVVSWRSCFSLSIISAFPTSSGFDWVVAFSSFAKASVWGWDDFMVSWRCRNVLLYPRVMCFDIAGGGGIRFCSSSFFSLVIFSSALFRFLLRLPFEGVMWAVLWWPMGSRRLVGS